MHLFLLDFFLRKYHAASHNGIKLDELQFLRRAHHVLLRPVKVARARRADQFDGDALALAAAGHLQEACGMHGNNSYRFSAAGSC